MGFAVRRLSATAPRIYYHSSEEMPEIRDASANLVVASPPYTNCRDGKTLDKTEYLLFLSAVFREARRVLRPGGYLVTINTDLRDHARHNGGDKAFDGLVWHKHTAIRGVSEGIGFRCVDTKIWAKSLSGNPYRYTFAYVQFFKKPASPRGRCACGRKEAAGFAADVWLLEGGMQRRDSAGRLFRDAVHPEIVSRCIERFTARGDLVVSTFTGSGTVPAVAEILGRRCIGYEIDARLESLIEESVHHPERFPAYRTLLQRATRKQAAE